MGRARQGQRDAEVPTKGELPTGPQGHRCRPRVTEGEAHRHRNGSRRRHVALDAGTSGGGWRVAGAGDSQVGGASHWERRWGASETRGL